MLSKSSKCDSLLHDLLLIVFTLAVTLSSLVLLARSNSLTFLTPSISRVQWHACPAPPSPLPYPALYPKAFHPMRQLRPSSYSGAADIASDDAIDWESVLLTPNGGFLMVEEAAGETKGYGVSMFHQLHCLTMIRNMLLGQAMSMAHETKVEPWRRDSRHWVHCLEYLTQAVICSADDTLERPKPTENFEGDVVDGIDGMGHTHQCRNATTLWSAVRESENVSRKVGELGRTSVFPLPER